MQGRLSGASITFWFSHIARYAPSPARRYLLPERRPCINISYWMEPCFSLFFINFTNYYFLRIIKSF